MSKDSKNSTFKTPHVIWGVLISFLLSNTLYFIIEPKDTLLFNFNLSIIAISLFTGFAIYALLIFIIRILFFKIKDINLVKKGIAFYFLFTNVLVILIMCFLLWIEYLLHDNFISSYFINLDDSNFNLRSYFVVNIVVATIINSFYSMLYFFNKWNQEEQKSKELLIETHKLKELSLQSELQMYKMQLDPHFLFNSFSMLTYLIDTDTDKAQLYLENLSNVYRYILTNSKKDVVKIETELELIEAYHELLKIRHQNNIILEIDVKPGTKQLGIAPITLQLLIENAIKHNKHSKKNPLRIQVTDAENGFISVKNNIQKIDRINDSIGVGLDNIKQRYSILSTVLPVITENQNEYIVKIPLLNE